jgi:hypothetical protein
MRSITEINGERHYKEEHPPNIKRIIELPWVGVAEIGIRTIRLQKRFERVLFPDNLPEMLESQSVRFNQLEGTPYTVAEDSLRIHQLVPYLISSKHLGLTTHVKFTVIIGDTYRMPVMLGQVDQGCGGTAVHMGQPVPVPPRQPLVVDIDFDCRTNFVLANALGEMLKDTNARFALGLRLVGFQRTEIRRDEW